MLPKLPYLLNLWGLNGRHFTNIFKCIFSWMKIIVFWFKFRLCLIFNGSNGNNPLLVLLMAWRPICYYVLIKNVCVTPYGITSHYLNQCWQRPLSPYGTTCPKWVKSEWPSDTIRRHRTEPIFVPLYGKVTPGPTLVQITACCLTAPSHYLNQYWLIINDIPWQSPQGDFTRGASVINY